MNKRVDYRIAGFARRGLLLMACGLFASAAAYSQSGGGTGESSNSCTATKLRLRIATSNDDLRGGQDNLNIVVFFTDGKSQVAANVNKSANWPNNSVNMVDIFLNQPVPPNEIRALRLIHIPDGSFHLNLGELITPAAPIALAQAFQSPDNWDMADVEVAALGNGVGARIATHGYFRFTGSDSILTFATHIPADVCGSGRPSGNSGGSGLSSSGRGSEMLLAPRSNTGSGTNQSFHALIPRSGSNSGSSGAPQSFQPLIPRNGSNSGADDDTTKPLTNADMVNMLRAGISEQIILTTMRTRPASFDVSNQSRAAFDRECAAMKPAGVSADAWATEVKNIWDTMTNVAICQQTNGRGGEGACASSSGINDGNRKVDELNPQPYPPKGGKDRGPAVVSGKGRLSPSTLLKAKLGQAKKGPTIINTAAAAHVQAMLTTLHNQKQAADLEAAQMTKLQAGLPGKSGIPTGPSQPMSASVGGNAAQASSRNVASMPTAGAAGTTTQSLSQRLVAIGSARLGPSETLALWCAQNPAMSIASVSGSEGPITFTTDPSGNFYTISGCSFGNPGPNAKAYIYYQNSFHQEFQIQQWNDNYIKCNLDPALTGVGDLNNLTLVIQRYDGQQAAKNGFQFYAMRETRRLAVFPQQYFSLYKFGLQDLSDLRGSIYSPGDPSGYFPNNTAEVQWSDPDLQNVANKGFMTQQNTPPSGTDIYDFSHLAPGFDVTEAYINSPDPSAYCSALGNGTHLTATTGSFGGQWNGSQLWITWQGWNCNFTGSNCNFWGCTDVFGYPPLTDYAVDVTVEGPRGVDPWTGQPLASH